MLNLSDILAQYPENLRIHSSNILKEYLQYKILASIYKSKFAQKLVFLGGTALRILHGNTRFSEDLDFDNLGLTREQFVELGKIIQTELELEGLEVEILLSKGQAYRLKIKIPQMLFELGLATLATQKILIQVDTVPQNFIYTPEQPLLNKFEVFTQIYATPKNLLLAQKIYACLKRARAKGRDFFDIVFLYGIGAQPDFTYLAKNLNLKNNSELRNYLLKGTASLDFRALAKDVEPFLFYPQDSQKILKFREFIKNI
jgi:predicted nucleotidyltransferase component of viral defense system